MTTTILGIGWLAIKAGLVVSTSIGLISGLQKHHDFKLSKKESKSLDFKRSRGGKRNVYTGEHASEVLEELRQVQEAK
ncbi:hypothetical protein [Halalkalibacter oceani]|uniref:hypothetical protein n=1 Tax=Halalkalibacter oceani TaxID=1653776 RepID=UPI00339716CF